MSPSQDNGVFGQQEPNTPESGFNAMTFLINQMLNKLSTVTLVKIIKVTNAGGVSPVGFVDVQPMVNQMTGDRKGKEHGIVYNIPYFRLQGGTDAVILDPKAGDIGMCGFCSRDISVVKRTKKIANAGSSRTFDWADGLYFGGVLNGAPTQYVQFSAAGIKLHSPSAVILEAPDVQISAATVEIAATTSTTVTAPTFTVNGATVLNGATAINGALSQGAPAGGGSAAATLAGPVTVTGALSAQGTDVHTHKHGGVQTGTGQTGAPV